MGYLDLVGSHESIKLDSAFYVLRVSRFIKMLSRNLSPTSPYYTLPDYPSPPPLREQSHV
jgi:hypothetical protein